MNKISGKGIGKKFLRQWIFRDVSFEANDGDAIAITGYNGSGKSTLLQIIAGYISPSDGNLEYFFKNQKIHSDNLFHHISLAAPYLELIEEFTLAEMIPFFMKFKEFNKDLTAEKIVEATELGSSIEKQIKHFSSGMKQRLKLTLALMNNAPYVFLDEPHSNLDESGIKWFNNLLIQQRNNKIIFVSSNRIQEETGFCNKFINLEDFKKA